MNRRERRSGRPDTLVSVPPDPDGADDARDRRDTSRTIRALTAVQASLGRRDTASVDADHGGVPPTALLDELTALGLAGPDPVLVPAATLQRIAALAPRDLHALFAALARPTLAAASATSDDAADSPWQPHRAA